MSSEVVQAQIDSGMKRALPVGLVGVVLLLIIGVMTKGSGSPAETWQLFYHAYLVGFVFCAVLTIGCLALLMIHHMTGGWWGYPLRRIYEAGARTLPLIVILFVPLIIGMQNLYIWARPDVVSGDAVLQAKAWYLNHTGFVVRAIVYFSIFALLIYRLTGISKQEDETGHPSLANKMERTSAPGLVIGAFALTVASIDWQMSLEARWFSTIYGFLFIVVCLLAAHSFAIITFTSLSKNEPLKDAIEPSRHLDIGNLLLAFTILWTYMSFSQFLITWSGNIKQEIPFYMSRAFNGWAVVASLLLIFHFFVPFFALLQRSVKRKLSRLAKVAILQLTMTVIDLYWQIFPSFQHDGPKFPDFTVIFAVLGLGGIWVAFFLYNLKRLPLLPAHDPRFVGHSPAIPPVSDFLHVHGRRPEA
jgi:hypothetical protein